MSYLLQLLLAVRHETRMVLRSWPFRITAFILLAGEGLNLFGLVALIYFVSADSYLGPLYVGSNTTLLVLTDLTGGLIFLVVFFANDVGCRDKRVGLSDVVGSRPMAETQHVIARFLGVMIPFVVLPAALLVLSLAVNKAVGFRTAPFRVYAPFFVCYCALSVALCAALAAFLSTVLRHRLFASLVALVPILVSIIWLTPLYDIFDIQGTNMATGGYSELIGAGPLGGIVLHKLLYLCLTLCFLSGAVFFYPRPEAVRRGRPAVLAFIVLLGSLAGLLVYCVSAEARFNKDRDAWRVALAEASANRATAVDRYEMDVEIIPRRGRIQASVATTLRNREETARETFVFTLNPGLTIEGVSTQGGLPVTVERRGPLVELTLATPLGPGETLELLWDYGGAIDPKAAWLVEPFLSEDWIASNLRRLDTLMGKFSGWVGKRYCFLLPESHWYPVPGSTFGYEYPDKAPANFATARIQLRLPSGWTGVTQGVLAEQSAGGEGPTLVFEVDTPVPQFSLCAGEYEMVRTTVAGVECAFYYAPIHRQNVDFFADATEEIERVIGESFERISDKLRLDYPYRSLSVVEVPSSCRVFADTPDGRNLLVQPGVLFLRESDFFNVFFAQTYKRSEESTMKKGTGATPAQIKAELLKRYIEANEFGGDLELNLIPNYWEFQVDPSGPAYPALGAAFTAALSDRALGRQQPTAGNVRIRSAVPTPAIAAIGGDEGGQEIRIGMGLDITSWRDYDQEELVLPLGTITPSAQEERFVELMNRKTAGMWETLAIALGEEAWPTFVRDLLATYRFKPITLEDVEHRARSRASQDVAWVFDQFVTQPVVPGYVITHAEAYEIDTGRRERQFQTVLRIANIEEGRGYVRLRIETEGPDESNTVERELLFDSREEKEIRMVLREKPTSVRVVPVCARNVQVPFETLYVDEERREVPGEESVRVLPEADRAVAVIVDDLDEGFSVIDTEEDSRVRLAGAQGQDGAKEFPDYAGWGTPRRWQNQRTDRAYGKYIHTRKIKRRGDGTQQAVWSAALPRDGVYEVFFYAEPAKRGRYTIRIDTGASSQEVELELATAKSGWNSLGKYAFKEDGPARVTLSDDVREGSRNARVYADAVRWVHQAASDEVP